MRAPTSNELQLCKARANKRRELIPSFNLAPVALWTALKRRRLALRWASKIRVLNFFAVVLALSAHLDVVHARGTEEATPSNTTPDSGVGFKTVAEALDALKNTPGANINYTKPDNWIVITEPSGKTFWSFTPHQHDAYPAVVKRELKVRPDGGVYVEMSALCQADKSACDKLIEEFKQLNNRARAAVQQKLNQGAGQ